LWIRFNLSCDGFTQQKLHKIFRQDIKEWEQKDLVKGAVLTYHFGNPTKDPETLYLCLNILAVHAPRERTVQLSGETIGQIPLEIINRINQICIQHKVVLDILDYEFDIASNCEHATKTGQSYYRGASTEEILRFASTGTSIAISLLNEIENREITFINNMERADVILSRLKKELGENYYWMLEAFHFVCNPMLLLNDGLLWILANC